MGGQDTTTFDGLQHVDFGYNIRGWLTDINNHLNLYSVSSPTDLFAFHINYNEAADETNYDGKELYNGNIAETYWISKSDNVLRKYGYHYDGLNRLTNAIYQKPNAATAVTNSYNESMTYDKNGNIQTLDRWGDLDTDLFNIKIDELTYQYHMYDKNKLMKVSDETAHPEGFTDDAGSVVADTNDDYTYDANGNMISDENKNLESISYNHLNLPVKMIFSATNQTITYLYDATGRKVQKTVTNDTDETVTDYLNGFQYEKVNGGPIELKFFPHAEGYVNNTVIDSTNVYKYVYQYKDHLGNVRMSYTEDLMEEGLPVILEENHYYPYGLKHTKYNATTWDIIKGGIPVGIAVAPVANLSNQYKYNGKEWQGDLGLNMYAMDMRQYDPAIARWVVQDPVVHHSQTTYNAFDSNPVYWADPSGADAIDGTQSFSDLFSRDAMGRKKFNEFGIFIPIMDRQDDGTGAYDPTGPMPAFSDGGDDDDISSFMEYTENFVGLEQSTLEDDGIDPKKKRGKTKDGEYYGGDGSGSFSDYAARFVFETDKWNPIALAWDGVKAKITGTDRFGNKLSSFESSMKIASAIPIGKLENIAYNGIKSFTAHGVNQAITRGFTTASILKIIREGSAKTVGGRYGVQTRYVLGENTVIVNSAGKVVTVYSTGKNGNFIPFK